MRAIVTLIVQTFCGVTRSNYDFSELEEPGVV